MAESRSKPGPGRLRSDGRAREEPVRGRERREARVLAIVLAVAVVGADLLFYADTMEDAFITFRYSRHLVDGHGIGAWNAVGERVEGYTPTLWMLWLAAAEPLGLRIETLAKWTGIASHLALCLLFLAVPVWGRRDLAGADTPLGRSPDVYWIAALVTGLYVPMVWYATTGMETTSFALLVALGLLVPLLTDSALAVAAVGVALVLMRPEGVLFGFAANSLHVFLRRRAGESARAPLAGLAAVLLGFAALSGFRLWLFGDPLPNTYYAKAAGALDLHVKLGRVYLGDWAGHHVAWLAVLAWTLGACAVSTLRRGLGANIALISLLGLAALYAAYVVRVGGDNPTAFPYWRQSLHVFPLVALALGAGLASLIPRPRALRFAAMLALLILTNANALETRGGYLMREARAATADYPDLVHAAPNEYYVWLANLADPSTVVASSGAGEMPFVVDAIHIDMLGLNDRHIAHHGEFDPNGPVDSKSDIGSVLERRPDVIQSGLPASKFMTRDPKKWIVRYRRRMFLGMLRHPIFQSEYLFLKNGPYRHLDRAIFLRRTWWEAHPQRDELECVPVTETPLYRGSSEIRPRRSRV